MSTLSKSFSNMIEGSCKILNLASKVKYDFKDCYLEQCKNRNIVPPTRSLATQSDSSKLKINADSTKFCDWEALYSVLKIENSLKEICIYSKKAKRDWPDQCVIKEADTSLVASACSGPAIFTRYILEKLIRTLEQSLQRCQSKCEVLRITLPLSPSYTLLLSRGFGLSAKIKHLSLSGSCIGDQGCHYVCGAVKSMPNIQTLDLSECKLGLPAIESLIMLIHSHGLMRSTLSWESSFRYRSPEKRIDIGLVRLSLNRNPFGDEGAKKLASKLKEDLWIKAIDLQQCLIKNSGAIKLLDMLATNESLIILDIRGNRGVCNYIQNNISKALENGNRGLEKKEEFDLQWLPAPTLSNKHN